MPGRHTRCLCTVVLAALALIHQLPPALVGQVVDLGAGVCGF